MSILTNGVSFSLGDGWQYAPESTTTNYTPGTFTTSPLFLADKNGAAFAAGTEYRFFAKHPILDPDPILYGFSVATDGTITNPYQIPTISGNATLQNVIANNPIAIATPHFNGGIIATLQAPPTGVTLTAVYVGPDGTLYGSGVVTPPSSVFNFSGGVHYEAVPIVTSGSTTPTLDNPTADWAITTRGVSEKVLEANEFGTSSGGTYLLQAWHYDGGTNIATNLPDWIAFNGATRTLSATISSSLESPDFIIRITKSDQTGAAVNDDFLCTLRLPAANACSNYFPLSDAQIGALPILFIAYFGNGGTNPRPYVSRAEAISGIGNGVSTPGFFGRASTTACNVGDTLYGDQRSEHIADNTYNRWPIQGGWLGVYITTASGGTNGSYTLLNTSPCGVIVSRETITLPAN